MIMKAEKIEEVQAYLEGLGIKVNYEPITKDINFNRILEIEIEGEKYYIEWWVNQSYFRFKNKLSAACVPFKYINVNHSSPTTKHKLHLCFYDKKEPNKDQFLYNEIPIGALRIPFNKL